VHRAMSSLQELAHAAIVQREALRDKSYQAMPLGREVKRYLRWLENEWGATEDTIRGYESVLSRFSLFFADLELADLAPPVGTERIREFVAGNWKDAKPATKSWVLSVLSAFFMWAMREQKMYGNPTQAISRPRRRSVARGTFTSKDVQRVLASQPRLRDRVALQLLFRLGLRKGELQRLQFKHYDGSRKRLTVFGKGGKIRQIPIVDEAMRLDLERHILERHADPDEFLLYPETVGPRLNRYRPGDNWDDRYELVVLSKKRFSPLTASSMHRWWVACLERAGIAHRPMHEARHTALTDFLRSSGNLKLTQQLAGHASIQTTADIYAHLDDVDLEVAMREWGESVRAESVYKQGES
jgi:site-specific recombinase XerD